MVAKVGDRVITLGDYAATLERMDQFDRLRYQSPGRKRELLEEIIDVELLAKTPGKEARSAARDAAGHPPNAARRVARRGRRGCRRRPTFPPNEVRAYYDAHLDDSASPNVGALRTSS